MTNQTQFYTPADAAKALNVHINTLRKMGDTGRIPVTRLPSGHRRYDVDRYFAERAIAATGDDALTFARAAKHLGLSENLFERLINAVAPSDTPPRRRIYTAAWLDANIPDMLALRDAAINLNLPLDFFLS